MATYPQTEARATAGSGRTAPKEFTWPKASPDEFHTEILPALTEAAADLRSLGDLGYEGEADTITVAFKKPKDTTLTALQQQFNKAHNSVRAIGERGNAC